MRCQLKDPATESRHERPHVLQGEELLGQECPSSSELWWFHCEPQVNRAEGFGICPAGL